MLKTLIAAWVKNVYSVCFKSINQCKNGDNYSTTQASKPICTIQTCENYSFLHQFFPTNNQPKYTAFFNYYNLLNVTFPHFPQHLLLTRNN